LFHLSVVRMKTVILRETIRDEGELGNSLDCVFMRNPRNHRVKRLGPKRENAQTYQAAVAALEEIDQRISKKECWDKEEARDWASKYFQVGKEFGAFDTSLDKQKEVALEVSWLLHLIQPYTSKPKRIKTHFKEISVYLKSFIERSNLNTVAFDALQIVASVQVRNQVPMPTEIAEWTAKRIRGEVSRPKKRGKYTDALATRNMNISRAVVEVSNHGFCATRNDASYHITSACDIVSEALKFLELSHTSYDEVKKIYLNFKDLAK
jgi:hypothetical protein